MKVLPSECECERCSVMCQAPCCGTPEDINKLMKAGYANRLMFDDWPDWDGGSDMLKPAMKGSEGSRAPWETRTEEGCTFWKDGKCELHKSGLKPIQGKLVTHDSSDEQIQWIIDKIRRSWKTKKAKAVIKKWKKFMTKDQ